MSLVTAAIPYMNGRLHLGHAMTYMNAEVSARFLSSQGLDVLFPFGFHVTGMPIYANAMKLQEGDQTVRENLLFLGVDPKDIEKFKDPRHWVRVFPEQALQDIVKLGFCVDTSRSFVTTDMNPYFDSFVKWQYTQLRPFLAYEKRPCIYSIKDGQPCADHDRQTGEGVKPQPYHLHHMGGGFLLGDTNDSDAFYDTHESSTNHAYCYVILGKQRYEGVMPVYWYQNLVQQGHPVKLIEMIAGPPTPATPIEKETPHPASTGITIYLPASRVVSRSGDECVVATVPQWYIQYSDPVWKQQVLDAISKMTIHNPEVRKQLVIAARNMGDWCVSREYGLGTALPHDMKFLIDSLSDSTIYMAYYTVCHLLHEDIYGNVGKVPVDMVNNAFWDHVLLGADYQGAWEMELETVMKEARAQFLKYYPPRLRVSGKDLIYNHLVMSIYHHVKIFGPDTYIREYMVNGYAKVNGQKMSKSLGNIILLSDALEKYRTDVLRVILVEAGTGLEDSNIRLTDHKHVAKALDQFHAMAREAGFARRAGSVGSWTDIDKLFLNVLAHGYQETYRAYTEGKFREGLTMGWRKTCKLFRQYLSMNEKSNQYLIDLSNQLQIWSLQPVIGSNYEVDREELCVLSEHSVDSMLVELWDFLQIIDKRAGKYAVESIKIHERLKPYESIICNYLVERNKSAGPPRIVYNTRVLHEKCNPFKVKPVITSAASF